MRATTYLLVPGAGDDSFHWHLLTPLLEAAGHEVVAVDLPCADEAAGLAEYADAIVAAGRDRGPVTIVAQSMGAFSAPQACARLDTELLVLLAPMIPAPGETPGGWWRSSGHEAAWRAAEQRAGRDPDAPIDERTTFFHDVPPAVVDAAYAHGFPDQAERPFGDPWPLRAWPGVPTRVVAGRHDRLMPLGFVERLARERPGAPVDVLDSGHLPALSRPEELAATLLGFRAA